MAIMCSGPNQRHGYSGCCGNHTNGSIAFMSGNSSNACANMMTSNVTVVCGLRRHGESQQRLRFYINGIPSGDYTTSNWINKTGFEGSKVATAPITIEKGNQTGSKKGNLTFGAYSECGCMRYHGFLDEVRLWHTIVSGKDIDFHKNFSVVDWHTDSRELIAYYKFDIGHEYVAKEFFNRGGYNMSLSSSGRQDVLWNNKSGFFQLAPGRTAPPPPLPPPVPSPPPPSPPLPAPNAGTSDNCVSTRNDFDIMNREGNATVYFDGVNSFGFIRHGQRLVSFTNATKKTLSVEVWIKPDGGEDFAGCRPSPCSATWAGSPAHVSKGCWSRMLGNHLWIRRFHHAGRQSQRRRVRQYDELQQERASREMDDVAAVNGTDWNETVTNLTAMGGNVNHPNVSQATVTFYIDGKEAAATSTTLLFPRAWAVVPSTTP